MAKISLKMPDDFLIKISRLKDKTDEIVPLVLDAGAKVVQNNVKDNLKSVIGYKTKYPSRHTNELISSLGITPVLIDKKGNHNVKIGFSEPRKDGKSNSMIANTIEYGKSGQPAKPFLKPARLKSRKPCIEAMIRKLDEEIEKL